MVYLKNLRLRTLSGRLVQIMQELSELRRLPAPQILSFSFQPSLEGAERGDEEGGRMARRDVVHRINGVCECEEPGNLTWT